MFLCALCDTARPKLHAQLQSGQSSPAKVLTSCQHFNPCQTIRMIHQGTNPAPDRIHALTPVATLWEDVRAHV